MENKLGYRNEQLELFHCTFTAFLVTGNQKRENIRYCLHICLPSEAMTALTVTETPPSTL